MRRTAAYLPGLLLGFLWLTLLSGCQPTAFDGSPLDLATATPMAPPLDAAHTQSPLLDEPVITNTQLIDAEGLDFAERRVIELYDRVAPSVVNITTQTLRRTFFFEIVPQEGSGSGFVIDTEGHILTNFHVIENAERIEVGFGDELILPAQVVGRDARNDLAVLQVDAPLELLHPVQLGTSSNLRVGQRAIAVGNPFGQFERTLTTGVISAVGRTLEGDDGRAISGAIQTDAAINRGNSGGPLLDSSGRVIGINTAIFSPSGTSAGVGFAVPVDTVKRLLPDLLTLGRYPHPWLGVRYAYTITPGLAELLDLPVESGLLLVQLHTGSPLAEAGLRGADREMVTGNQRIFVGGDIITAVAGEPILRFDQMETFLEDHYRVGDTVEVTVYRGEETFALSVTLGEEPLR